MALQITLRLPNGNISYKTYENAYALLNPHSHCLEIYRNKVLIASSLIGSRVLVASGDVDGSSAANNRPSLRTCTARLFQRSDTSSSAHGCARTRNVRLGGAGSVG